MFFNWINKIKQLEKGHFHDFQLGNCIENFNSNTPFIDQNDITIAYAADLDIEGLRKELFSYSKLSNSRIIELGKLKKANKEFNIPLFGELINNNILILIGDHKEYDESIEVAFKQQEIELKKTLISNSITFAEFSTINYLGFQRHLSDQSLLEKLSDFNKYSLGDLRSNIKGAEPLLRDRNYICIEQQAIKRDASFQKDSKVTGLTIEEACHLAKYAGHNPSLKVFHIAVNPEALEPQWEQTTALLIWYLLEGIGNNVNEKASDASNLTYIVNSNSLDLEVTFIKGLKTGRWWLKDPRKNQTSQYIPCQMEDYNEFCEGNIPDKFLELIR